MTCAGLAPLPFELWAYIGSFLSKKDIKSLRLTCTLFNNAIPLRLNRVFLSANPLNIEVFRNIASHEKFRHEVTEIVWDEALLARGPARSYETRQGEELLSDEDEIPFRESGEYQEMNGLTGYGPYDREGIGCPKWFKDACDENIYMFRNRKEEYVETPEHTASYREQIDAQPSLKECWQHYQHLLGLQKDVLADDSDSRAFSFGLKQFPALKRVTITPAAHGHLFLPLYQTPMMRAFPKGFNYPIPRGWLKYKYEDDTGRPPTAYMWNQYPELRKRYRGFCSAMRLLANEPNSVSELVMTSNCLPTGINSTIFDEPCEEYDNFVKVLKTPGFRRLDISLLVGGENQEELEPCWRAFLNGRLRYALSQAKEMEEFRLHTTLDEDLWDWDSSPLIPLNNIVPVGDWSSLRHFELSLFTVSIDDCFSFFSTLPQSVRSVELSMLEFFLDGGCWYTMLEGIRRRVLDGTLWRDLITIGRPKIKIGVHTGGNDPCGRAIWLDKEVQDYICGNRENPFPAPNHNYLEEGTGTLKDAFDPNYERPHVDSAELERLNICKSWHYSDLSYH